MSKSPAAPKEETLFRFFNEVGIIAQLSATAFERVMPHEMTLAQFSVLNHCVRLGDGKSPASLASAFQVTRGTMTSTLQKLDSKGFIDVRADASDGRAKRVFLTPAGRAARNDALKALQPGLTRMAKALDTAEMLKALPALEHIRAWLDEDRTSL